MDAFHTGLLFAALSAVFNGSFGVLTKLPKARTVPPLIMNYWMAQGVGLSGILLLAVPPRVFSWWGLLSGALFVGSAANAVTAIALIGVSAATGVWCGVAVVVSFAWGVLVAGDEVAHMGRALAALALILAGIAGVAVAAWVGGGEADGGDARERAEGMGENLLEGGEATVAVFPVVEEPWPEQLPPTTRALLGLGAAVLAGCIGGLILAPMLAAPPEARGVQFVPSLALGALLVAPLYTSILTATQHITFTQATSSRAAGPGLAAGAVWNAGNTCCIAAVTNPQVGLAVAMPVMQAGLFVAGLWGICLYREIRGARALAAYWCSGAVLVLGVALLAAAKRG